MSGGEGRIAGVGIKDTVYAIAKYIEIDFQDETDTRWRVHISDGGVTSPSLPAHDEGTTTGVLETTEVEDLPALTDLGTYGIVMVREADTVWMEVNGKRFPPSSVGISRRGSGRHRASIACRCALR